MSATPFDASAMCPEARAKPADTNAKTCGMLAKPTDLRKKLTDSNATDPNLASDCTNPKSYCLDLVA